MPTARARLRLSVGAVVVLGLTVLSVAVGLGIVRGQAEPVTVPVADAASGQPSEGSDTVTDAAHLYVHVLGRVEHPGLYVLDPDARVVDALSAAGGTLDDADLHAVNLARALTDGEQIVVPAIGESPVTGPGPTPVPPESATIDLNSADQAALETLPGIGPALAGRIIQWREENGPFRSVDDLLAVPGIGEKLLEGLRGSARV